MSTTSSDTARTAPGTSTGTAYTVATALRTGVLAGAVAAVLNLGVSAIARGPLDAGEGFAPLTPGPIVMWTIVGALVGALGWRLLVNTRTGSRALLGKLVPAVVLVSFVPDVALLATDAMPGQTTVGVLALMVMHVVTAVVVVTAYRRAMPPR